MDKETKPSLEDGEGVMRQQSSIEDHESYHGDKPVRSKEASNDNTDIESQKNSLHQTRSHMSTHDAMSVHDREYGEEGDEVYDRFTPRRKIMIVSILSLCSFLAPMSSTSILSASPEVVAAFNTTGTIFNISNALYMLFMGFSPLFWGPIGQAFGRKKSLVCAAITFTAFSAGSALAPNLAAYFVFRMLTAFQGTAFLIIGGTAIGDIYAPTQRGTAYAWFLSGTLIGPALGPLIGGIIVTYAGWRDIFWLQTALAGVATLSCMFFLPETIHKMKSDELVGLSKSAKVQKIARWINPARVIFLLRYPNLILVGLAASSLVWNMYSLLTPIRYVLGPRYGLTTPVQAGLFYIAPGAGYLIGTFFGGRWSDHYVRKYTKIRGQRIPEDRLKSTLVAMGIVIPASMIVYGWAIQKEVGGIPLPVIAMVLQGIAQLICFPSLNAYCLDVIQSRSSEVVGMNYVIRYLFGALGSALVLPIVDAIGVGWFSTISAAFVALSALGTYAVTIWGKQWRDAIDEGKEPED